MLDLLNQISLPALLLACLAALWPIAKQLIGLVVAQRSKLAQEIRAKELMELDHQLQEFYLPVRERLAVAKEIYDATEGWLGPSGSYDNQATGIESTNDRALRDIAVRRVFLPLNKEVQRILLERQHLRHEDDTTNYRAILRHLILWSALEEAAIEREIDRYKDNGLLAFPADETDRQAKVCETLLEERSRIRRQVLRLGTSDGVTLKGEH